MKNVIVTGAAGYIGTVLCQHLFDKGYNVIAIDNMSTGNSYYEKYLHEDGMFEIDIRNTRSLDRVFEVIYDDIGPVDCIFHIAALSVVSESDEKFKDYRDVNVTGTVNLLKKAEEYNIENFVFASTAAVYNRINENVYEDPQNFYGVTKLIAEQMLKIYDVNTAALRLFNVVGAGDYGENRKNETHLIPRVIDSIFTGKPMEIYDLKSRRDYIDVNDVAEAFICHYEDMKEGNHVVDVCSGISYTNRTVIDLCENVTGKKLNYDHKPKRSYDPSTIKGEVPHFCYNKELLQSIEDYVKWYKIIT